jgi:glutamyl-tRNA synthetase
VEGATDIIFRTLEKAGLPHDEGPDRDGGFGPYVQSERMKTGIYLKYAKELIGKKEAYYCFCDKERLQGLKTEVVEGKEIMLYDKHCLSLTEEEIEANLAAGRPYVIRQNNPIEGSTTFRDELYGDITVNNSELDDMILIKSDGYPTYNFANVVDDHTMNITHVVRGNEYLSSSPKYVRLYEALGWDIPIYVHLPLITDENHKKLSKRGGHSSFEELLEQGFLPEAIVNYIALLGWSPEDNREIYSLEELVKEFDYKRISKSPAVFDIIKLRWMNGEYLKAMKPETFYELARPYLEETLFGQGDALLVRETPPLDQEPPPLVQGGNGTLLDLRKIAEMVRTRIEIFPEIDEMVNFFRYLPEYDTSMYAHKKMKTDTASSLEVLKDVLPILERQADYGNDALYKTLSEYVEEKGRRNGYVMWPIRTAVSGKQMTPAGATEIMEILGKEESLKRIRKGIEMLEAICS